MLLGLPPMNQNDAYAPAMGGLFSGSGDQPAFKADYRNLKNGLIYETNKRDAAGASESAKMDFSRPDAAGAASLNKILWRDQKGAGGAWHGEVIQRLGRHRGKRTSGFPSSPSGSECQRTRGRRGLLSVDSTRSKDVAQKCSGAATSRDTGPAIRRTSENKPAQVASNPSCSPTREAVG